MDWSECFQTGSRRAVHWDSTGKPPAKPPLVNHTSLCSVNKKTTNHHWLHQGTFVFEGEDRTSKYFHTGVVSRGTGVGGKTRRGTGEPHGCSALPAHTALECYPSHTRNPPHQLRSTQNRKEGSVLIITCVISRWVPIALSDSDILWVFPLITIWNTKRGFPVPWPEFTWLHVTMEKLIQPNSWIIKMSPLKKHTRILRGKKWKKIKYAVVFTNIKIKQPSCGIVSLFEDLGLEESFL